MIRTLTAAALAALLAVPALAQDVTGQGSSEQQPTSRSESQLDQQTQPGQSLDLQSQQGAENVPDDCVPNDIRPACQTAQIPSDETPSSEEQTGQSPYGSWSDEQQGSQQQQR